MRRPLKPFVTEYKQANRRNQNLPPEPSAFETERPAPRLVDVSLRDPEDSYEAAMRAADALFSPKPTSEPREGHGRDASPSRPIPTGSYLASAAETPSQEMPSPEKLGGRILRVLDEAPPAELIALEAEHAPKRRGRKPGSKNKPKATFAQIEAVPAASFEAVSLPATKAVKRPAAKQVAAITTEAAPLAKTTSRAVKRFTWARDRLKPGEDWKRRRLPRVCW